MTSDLKSKSINATKWSFYAQLGQYGLNFILSIILARILLPQDFGLTGMLVIFTSIPNIFINSGLSVALVRAVDVSEDDLSTMFVFNLIVSVSLYIILFFAAPYVALFYNEASLTLLMRLMTLVIVINAFGIVQNTILLRKVALKKQSICYLSGMACSVIVSSYMAFNGFGVYSLVGQVLSQAIVTNIALWISNQWIPKLKFNKESFLKQWKFGSKILSTNLLSSVIDNVDNVLIGKVFSAVNLGFFIRAKSTKQIPESIFRGTLNTSSFAILSKINNNKEEFNKMHLYFFNFALYIYFPLIVGLIVLASPMVEIIYSARWLPAVPVLKILCIGSIPIFIDGLFIQTFMALGEVNTYLKITTIKKLITLLSIPIGLFFGIIPFAISIVLFQYVGFVLNILFTIKILDIKIKSYVVNTILPIIGAILMGLILYNIQDYIVIKSKVLHLLIIISIGVIWYILFSLSLRIKQFVLIKDLVFKSKYFKFLK